MDRADLEIVIAHLATLGYSVHISEFYPLHAIL